MSGAGRGIGAAIAQALDGAGARVALIARTESQLRETAATLTNDPVVIVADLGTHEGPPAAAAEALDAFGGRVDVLVNNAAVALRKPSDELTADEIDWMLHTQRPVGAAAHDGAPAVDDRGRCGLDRVAQLGQRSARHAAPRRLRGEQGGGRRHDPGLGDGVRAASASAANAVAPGVVHTEMWRENLAKPGVAESVTGVIPTRRLTEPSEVANVVPVPRLRRVERDHGRDAVPPTAGCTPRSTSTRPFEDSLCPQPEPGSWACPDHVRPAMTLP